MNDVSPSTSTLLVYLLTALQANGTEGLQSFFLTTIPKIKHPDVKKWATQLCDSLLYPCYSLADQLRQHGGTSRALGPARMERLHPRRCDRSCTCRGERHLERGYERHERQDIFRNLLWIALERL